MSSEMNFIMSEWRSFEDREKLLSSADYVSNVLGIPLPLNESYPYSPLLTEQILSEQLLLEGWMDSVKTYIADKSKPYKDFFTTWTDIMTNAGKLESFLRMVEKNIRREIMPPISEAVNLLRIAGLPQVAQGFTALIEKFDQMKTSWKKAIVASSLYAVLKYVGGILTKLNISSVIDSIKDKTADEAKNILAQIPAFVQIKDLLINKFKELVGPELIDKAVGLSTDVKSYLGWIGPIVGTVDAVVKSLSPMTSKLQHKM